MSLLQQRIENGEEEPDIDMAIAPITDKEELIGRLAESVSAKDSPTLQAYILEQHLPDVDQFWELTTLLAPCLTDDNLENNTRFFTTVRRCLVYFSRHGKPKEMVLAYLEQLEGFQDDARFVALLPCLQNALLQLPIKRGRSLELALDTLSCHIMGIPAPKNWDLEGEEIKLLETDKTVQRYLNVIPALLEFMQPFLEGVNREDSGDGPQWERRVLKKHLLKLLQHPLLFLDLRFNSKEDAPMTYSREIAESVVKSLTHLERNFFRLLLQSSTIGRTLTNPGQDKSASAAECGIEDADMEAENTENESRASGRAESKEADDGVQEDELSLLSGACLLYLVQVEHLGQKCWPSIHSICHLLRTNLPFVHALLIHAAHTAVYKGLTLFSFYLDLVSDSSLRPDFLDDDNVILVVNALINVMRLCPIRSLRLAALAAFKTIFSKTDCHARYQLMKSVLSSCDHSGVKAVVISLLKNEIDMAFKAYEKNQGNGVKVDKNGCLSTEGTENLTVVKNERMEYFWNSKLEQLLHLATRLPAGAASDLLEEVDIIMATLNLLRYLVVRDPGHSNVTGVWDMLKWVEKGYLSALRLGLDMSVGHYKLELDNLTNKSKKQPARGDKIESVISVAGSELPPMTHDQRLNVMQSAVTTFDMMKCVLARLSELVDQKAKV